MKTGLNSLRQQRASVLIAALMIGMVMTITLVSYLSWAQTQNNLIMRSQQWNAALPLAEAGLEEALTHMATGNSNKASRGWVLQGGYLTKQRNLGDGYYLVKIETGTWPDIITEGFVRSPFSPNQYISRKIVVTTTNRLAYFAGITVNKGVRLSGNNVYIDSYDSTDPLYNTGGKYDAAKAKDNGHIASNDGILDALNLGNADVFGKVTTAVGGSVTTGPNGGVGSFAWRGAGNNGVEPGWVRDDFNLPLLVVKPPDGPLLNPSGGTVNGKVYDYILTEGAWKVNDLTGSVLVTGDAVLVVNGVVNVSGNSEIRVEQSATLKMWVLGATTQFGSKSIVNESGIPDDLQYYGGRDHVSFDASGAFAVDFTMNAPKTDVTIGGGGGGNKINISGAIVARSLKLTGRVDMHFDESLLTKSSMGLLITSWTEL